MVQIRHLHVITCSCPFCKYHNALCLGGNFEAIHMGANWKTGATGKQYCCAPGHNINNNYSYLS